MNATATETLSNNQSHGVSKTALYAIALVIMADYLLFDAGFGLNIAALAAITMLMMLVHTNSSIKLKSLAFFIALISALPLIEAASPNALLVSAIGMSIAGITTTKLLPDDFTRLPQMLLKFICAAPIQPLKALVAAIPESQGKNLGLTIVQQLAALLVPSVFLLIFVSLFSSANPLIEQALEKLDFSKIAIAFEPGRIMLWLIVAIGAWALLRPQYAKLRPGKQKREVHTVRRESLFFGESSIRLSLILFNALFAIQTILDMAYLWGGVELPEGLSYAAYAHRGAYPLIVTALLAAGFVLVAMRKSGPGTRNKLIRVLVFVWVVQNILLCSSAILRLNLYVEIYSLTLLRVAAGIWMVLVALGLILILVKIFKHQSNRWLITANLCTLFLAFYVTALVDTRALIATYNVENSFEISGTGSTLDLDYMARLGPEALPAIDSYIEKSSDDDQAGRHSAEKIRKRLAYAFKNRPQGWRNWSLRDWRLENYLAEHLKKTTKAEPSNYSSDYPWY